MNKIVEELMRRDKISLAEAEKLVADAKIELADRMSSGEVPYDLCQELFGLEPDFLEDLY